MCANKRLQVYGGYSLWLGMIWIIELILMAVYVASAHNDAYSQTTALFCRFVECSWMFLLLAPCGDWFRARSTESSRLMLAKKPSRWLSATLALAAVTALWGDAIAPGAYLGITAAMLALLTAVAIALTATGRMVLKRPVGEEAE